MCLIELFCEIDDFCLNFEAQWKQTLLSSNSRKREKKCRLTLREVMTIVVHFHQSNYRCFKHYYQKHVQKYLKDYPPDLISYNRFIEVKKFALIPLICYLNSRKAKGTGISFIDGTSIEICHPKRAKRNQVFKGLAAWSKSSVEWSFGFKLHLVINEYGQLLGFNLTPGNIDERKVVDRITKNIFGKLFGDKGYIKKELFEQLFERGLQLITPYKKNMKNRLIPLVDKILLRKRSIIETVNDQLKNISQIEHSRHRSVANFLTNVVAALIAYTHQKKKPSLNFSSQEIDLLSEEFKPDNSKALLVF